MSNKLFFLVYLLIIFFCFPSHSKSQNMKASDHKDHKHDHSDSKATLKRTGKRTLVVQVQGMVCAFCAQGIKANFKKRKEVFKTDVNLDKMEVTVTLHEGKLLEESVVKKIVTDSGFAYAGIKN